MTKAFLFPTDANSGWIEDLFEQWTKSGKKYVSIPFYKFRPHKISSNDKSFWLYFYYSEKSTDDKSLKRKVLYRAMIDRIEYEINEKEFIDLSESVYFYNTGICEPKILFIAEKIEEIKNQNGDYLTDKDFKHLFDKTLLSAVRSSIAPIRVCSEIIITRHPSFITKGVFPENGQVYGKVIKVKEIHNQVEFILDIINEEMIKYDMNFIERRDIETIKPYFYFMRIITSDPKVKNLLKERREEGYYIYRMGKSRYHNTQDTFLVEGEVLFAASPLTIEKYLVNIEGTMAPYNTTNDLPANAIIDSKQELEELLRDIISHTKYCGSYIMEVVNPLIKSITIHHVGQGHNSEIEMINGEKGFYDIGRTYFSQKDNACDFLSFDFTQYRWIILSHWDMDHYLGVTLGGNTNACALRWIAPNKIVGSNARRLAWLIYLSSGRKPFLIGDAISGQIRITDDIKIVRGTGTSKNDSGLMLFVDGDKKFASLGDVSYSCIDWGAVPFNTLNYLVVSHHGAAIDINSRFFTASEDSTAIIPVGYNTYHHPTDSIIDKLKIHKFKEHITRKSGRYLCDIN